jgi:predicted nucleic acid-binding protein
MQSLSKIKSDKNPLFLDASVIINLVASDCSQEILRILDRPIFIEKTVCREFKRNPFDGSDSHNLITELVNGNCLKIIEMTEPQRETFLNLTGAVPPDDLDDGEAATLACASHQGAAVLDERKAIRIAARDFPHIQIFSSLDILCAESVISELGDNKVQTLVQNAIKYARMRIPFNWKNWVNEFLGRNQCDSISVK